MPCRVVCLASSLTPFAPFIDGNKTSTARQASISEGGEHLATAGLMDIRFKQSKHNASFGCRLNNDHPLSGVRGCMCARLFRRLFPRTLPSHLPVTNKLNGYRLR